MTTKHANTQEREEAIENLRSMLPPGSTVYTILRHVARSGMMRRVSLSTIIDGHPHDLDGRAARACGWTWDRDNGGIRVSGCGMDMGFHLVSQLGMVLYPKGYGCVGEGCPSNDHSNGDRDYTPHGGGLTPHLREVRIGADHWHGNRDSGCYAFRHRWI